MFVFIPQDCPPGSVDFRAEQCSKYDNVAFKNTYHEWLPYYGGKNHLVKIFKYSIIRTYYIFIPLCLSVHLLGHGDISKTIYQGIFKLCPILKCLLEIGKCEYYEIRIQHGRLVAVLLGY